MDYSSIHENEDLQTGASPWASSPQQTRSFSKNSTDVPPSPPPTTLDPPTSGSPDAPRPTSQQPAAEGPRLNQLQSEHSSVPYRQQQQEQQQQHLTQQQLGMNGQERMQYQHGAPDGHQRHLQDGQQSQRQQRPRPRFTMTAKINGMERAGRKDPMFRFDVHVRGCISRNL